MSEVFQDVILAALYLVIMLCCFILSITRDPSISFGVIGRSVSTLLLFVTLFLFAWHIQFMIDHIQGDFYRDFIERREALHEP